MRCDAVDYHRRLATLITKMKCQVRGLGAVLVHRGTVAFGGWTHRHPVRCCISIFFFPVFSFGAPHLCTRKELQVGQNGHPPPLAQPSGHQVSPVGLTPSTSSLQPPTPLHRSMPSKHHSLLLSCSEVYFHLSPKVTCYHCFPITQWSVTSSLPAPVRCDFPSSSWFT